MADSIKLELKEKDLNPGADTLKDLKDFKKDFESKLVEAKNKKTLDEAKALFPDVTFYYDTQDRVLQIGDVTMQASSPEQWTEWMSKIAVDVTALNAELAELDFQKTQEVNETANESLISMLQKIVDEQKDLKKKFEEFSVKNAPDGSNADVAKMFELTNKLESAIVSKNVLLGSAVTAASVAALEEQNTYLRGITEGYEKEGAKFDIKKFKEKNQKHISKDLQQLAKQFGIDLETGRVNATNESQLNTSIEKSYEQMSDVEKQEKLKNIMSGLLGSLKMIQNSQGQYEVNLTGAQYDQIMTVYQMGGANAGYQALGIAPKVAPGMRKVNRLNDKAERLRARGNLEKAAKFKKKAFEEAKDVAKNTKKIAAYSMGTAEENNKTEHFAELTNQVETYASENGYNGMSIDVVPYAPLFPNICEQIGRQQIRGFGYIDTATHGRVMINCPERMVSDARSYMTQSFKNTEPGLYAACQKNGGGFLGKDNILSGLFEKTNMTKEQAQTNSKILFAGVGIFAGLGLLRWIRTGKFKKDETKKDERYDRLGKLVLGGIGLNMVSQGLNGRGAFDNFKNALSGKMKLSDLWTKQGPESQSSAPLDCAKNCLRYIPGTVLITCCERLSNGDAKIDFAKLEVLLTSMIANETDPAKKKILEDQLAYIKLLKNDPKGQDYLNAALASLGLNYEKLSKTNESIDTTAEAARLRQLELVKYMTDNKLKFADGITWLDADITDFIYKNKGSLEDLKKKGKFIADTTPNQPSQDLSDPFVRIDADGNKVDVDPKTILDRSLWNIDLPLAKQLYQAQQNLAKQSIDVKFAIDKKTGVLLLHSVEMLTPIMYDNGGWYVGGESSGRGTDRFATRFESAEKALRVAHLTNRLIHEHSGKYDINEPFSASGENKDLMVGESGKLLQWIKDSEALDSGTARSLGGEEFARNIKGYAQYLNGIHNTNGESIWNKKGKVGYELRATYFENWLKGAKPLPSLKNEDKYDSNKHTTDTKNTTSEKQKPDALKEKIKDATETNKTDLVVDDADQADEVFVKSRALEWKKEYDPYYKKQINKEMPLEFYEAWSRAYGQNGNYRLDFIYNNTPYRRQGGELPPTRHLGKAQKSWGVGTLK